ncbi:ABC transporter permease [Halobacillus sp. BBL2006]|uniref:putative ABC transporter permease subunit n=1 Tax=Halobacillus sp. BBL2006 TaxID=1543706 RepID=UPI000541BFE4|nr:ABC transporter permease [Halobacillus sp. BBL2006]KHE72936.1 ABC transporter permease [Halobacillus sp. BBL2006]
MSKAWKLMKVMVKMQLSMAGKSSSEKIGYGFLILVTVPFALMVLYSLNSLIGSLYEALASTGNESVILGLFFVLMLFIFVFVSIGSVLSSFYFAEDVESFIALPFQPYQIIIGKSAVPFLSLYGLNALLLLPTLIFYGLHSSAGFLYYLFAALLWVLTPIIPFVLTSILIMFLMRFANISKNKDRTKIFVGLLGFVFAIGINVLIRLDSGNTNANMAQVLTEQNGMLGLVTKFFPTAYISSIALTEPGTITGILYFLLMIGLTIASIIIFLTSGQKVYFKGVLGLSGGKRNTFKEENIQRKTKQHSILFSLWMKEMKIIFRTPTFFTQIFVQSLFFPVFLIIIILFDTSGSAGSLGGMMSQSEGKTMILALFGFTVIALGINPASISSISREGKSWFNNLYLPIPAKTIIMSKIITAYTLSLLSLLLIGGAALWIIKVPVLLCLLWFVLSLVTSWITSILGLLIDLYQPKLNWTDEREVFKGRFIGFFALAIEALVFGIAIFTLWNINAFEGLWAVSGILFTFLLLMTFVCHHILNKMITQKFYTIL